ncbi:1-aminocyclopropane-1-carboxylate synthase 2 [Porphyridium purpureum]|uniref:1-aminocyclopropane-1-carboxylate synthase 2 n=1 Tax=Porphyridium purpureum TaxID=35688 RepID=A0A5J4Z4D1_PORPP|nr:1-aminocyclopropane-1-carboxylate synthase 2 [Porphyridium purpureum]|eukprot:POR3276..scf295_1
MASAARLNERLVAKLRSPLPNFIRDFFAYRDDAHDAETNPDGALFFSVSEDTFASRLTSQQISRDNAAFPIDAHTLEYAYSSGMAQMRTAAAAYLSQYVFKVDDASGSLPPAKESQVCMVAGCGGAVGLIAQMVVEPGEGVMLLAPHYRGFLDDLHRADVEVVVVPTDSESEFRVSEQAFKQAIAKAKKERGVSCKALIISNPNNPLGMIYSPEELLAFVAWVRDADMHLIVDEIYAQSVYGKQKFESIYRVLEGQLSDDVHILYGFGKDLGICGLRTGLVYTQNAVLNQLMPSANLISTMSNQTQVTVTRLIENQAWLGDLFAKRRARLARISGQICDLLDRTNVRYITPHAGFFIMCDLSRLCRTQSEASEFEVYERLVAETKIILTPGSYMNMTEFGWFRIVFSNSTDAAVDAFCYRLSEFLKRHTPPNAKA